MATVHTEQQGETCMDKSLQKRWRSQMNQNNIQGETRLDKEAQLYSFFPLKKGQMMNETEGWSTQFTSTRKLYAAFL